MARPIKQHEALGDPWWVNGPRDDPPLRCPECGAEDVTDLGDEYWRCDWESCDTAFSEAGQVWTVAEWQAEFEDVD